MPLSADGAVRVGTPWRQRESALACANGDGAVYNPALAGGQFFVARARFVAASAAVDVVNVI